MLFITAQQLPSFITWNKSRTPGYSWLWFPRFKPRQVPISQYLLQVTTFASGTLLNNIVFAFSVPPTLQIVFRSAGNCRAFSRFCLLLLVYYIIVESARAESWIVMNRSGSIYAPRSLFHGQALHAQTNCTSHSPLSVPYNGTSPRMLDDHSPPAFYPSFNFILRPFRAKIAVAIVSSGVIIATLFRPRTESPITIIRDPGTAPNYTSTTDATTAVGTVETSRYTLGIAMLLASLVCTGVHGALQERTYSTYGPYWRESIFYTVRPHY